MVSNPTATDAAALSSALGTLAWISLVATLATFFVATKLPKPALVPVSQPISPSPELSSD